MWEGVCEDVNWIHVVEGRIQWRASLNAVMNFRNP
jgi:hypothetical protein